MFCSKCGTAIPDGAKFCKSCGEPVKIKGSQINLDNIVNNATAIIKQTPKKTKLIAVGIILAIILVVTIFVIGKKGSDNIADTKGFKSYKNAVEAYITSIIDGPDIEKYIACFPAEMNSDLVNSYQSYRSRTNGTFMDANELQFLFINDITPEDKWSYKIASNDVVNPSELSLPYGFEIDECYSVTVDLEHSFKDQSGGKYTLYPHAVIKVAKIDGSWYVIEPAEGWIWAQR